MNGNRKMEGARAFSKGDARHSNPYEAGSIAFQDWMDGWAQQKAADDLSVQMHATQLRFGRPA